MSTGNRKLENFKKALARLEQGSREYHGENNLLRDGLIQRFEFTFELAWKSLKVLFEDEGLTGLNSPKTVLREAFATGIIIDEELWLAMLKDRNATVHIYSEELAAEICSNIQLSYVGELLRLAEDIEKRVNN